MIIYENHAKKRIIERKINEIWIFETVKYPDSIRRFGNKYIVTKKINGHTLELVYIKQQKYINIKTLYWL